MKKVKGVNADLSKIKDDSKVAKAMHMIAVGHGHELSGELSGDHIQNLFENGDFDYAILDELQDQEFYGDEYVAIDVQDFIWDDKNSDMRDVWQYLEEAVASGESLADREGYTLFDAPAAKKRAAEDLRDLARQLESKLYDKKNNALSTLSPNEFHLINDKIHPYYKSVDLHGSAIESLPVGVEAKEIDFANIDDRVEDIYIQKALDMLREEGSPLNLSVKDVRSDYEDFEIWLEQKLERKHFRALEAQFMSEV